MELKNYQQDVINDIARFNELLQTKNLKEAFRDFWDSKGVSLIASDDYLHEYDNTIKGVPRITVKVPTAGGKTFIACNALRTIFDSFNYERPKVVAWFVPSDTILKQTYEKLNDPQHPYRQKIDTLFNSKVRVYDKPSLLLGQNFSPVDVQEQLSILVLSIQSFATNSKDGRLVYRENENLTEFASAFTQAKPTVEGADKTALIQVLAHLNPVVIIDESHNFTAELRVETLQSINPKYILELTATPKRNSNIICFVDAFRLKKENMVKLPVIVYNHNSINDVIGEAINLQRSLESKAKEEEKNGGDYIRPIVLFQAQPKIGEDTETFDKIKRKLMEVGIAENQIKVKTANRDELNKIDLMDKSCEVRYIITVDALKEGWDCPFAYILASLANKNSRISVEQILGRILRQPYTRKHHCEFLNLSYVFTSSSDFQNTLEVIVNGLNKSGFSSKDYFAKDVTPVETVEQEGQYGADVFSPAETPAGKEKERYSEGASDGGSLNETGTEDIDSVNASEVHKTDDKDGSLVEVLNSATAEAEKYAKEQQENDEANITPIDIMNKVPTYGMKELFAEEARQIILPQFFLKTDVANPTFFEDGSQEILLEPNHLLKDFKLEKCDRNITFEQTSPDVVRIDLERRNKDEYVPKYQNLNESQLKAFANYIEGLNANDKIKWLSSKVVNMLKNKYNAISERSIRFYIKDVLKSTDTFNLQYLANNLLNTCETFDKKIGLLTGEYKMKQFEKLLDLGKIFCKESYALPPAISIKGKLLGITKSLYTEEEAVDGFENNVISQIASLDNVSFWHRNQERGKGFYINGFINHYPDFIVVLASGKVLMVETKGGHLDGSNSEQKNTLGRSWANKAGEKFKYFMVFDKPVEGAYSLPDFLNIAKQL